MSTDEALVVGVGSMGRRHVRNLRFLLPDASITAVATRGFSGSVPEGADRVAASLEDALLLRPSIAVIASPASLHAEHGIACATAGAHVLVEKPIAAIVSEAERLVDVCARSDRVLIVGYVLRFSKGLPAIRSLVRDGELGEVYYGRAAVAQYLPDWRPERDYRDSVSASRDLGGGVLLELSHDVDAICYAIGQRAEWVTAEVARLGDLEIDVEDWASMVLGFRSARGSVHMDFLRRDPMRELVIVGSRGTARWDAWSGDLAVQFAGEDRWILHTQEPVDRNAMYLEQIKALLAAAEGEPVVGANGLSGLHTLEIVEAALRSAAIGQRTGLLETQAPIGQPWTDR